MGEAYIEKVEKAARQIRLDILNMMGKDKAGHLGGTASCVEIVASLYFYKMRYNVQEMNWPDRDRFILSKGHAAPVQYSALSQVGFFPREELAKFKEVGAMLQGHPERHKTPGLEASTGSLGQGLSIGVGMAMGGIFSKRDYNVYVVLGDGELNEGQVWEAIMAASAFKLDNLIAIIDANKLNCSGCIEERFNIGSLKNKFEAFGWQAIEVDGHNVKQITEALDEMTELKGKPKVIIADTVKGKGFSFAENEAGYHHTVLSEELYQRALTELSQ